MLQFITSVSDKYSIAEEAQMAIEGGCQWIQVSKSLPAGVTQKDAICGLQQLCQENAVFLMVDSDVELAKEMRIHGVHLKKTDMPPAEVRELLGPNAVIGVDADSAADIIALKGLDIDYAVINYDSTHSIEEIGGIIQEVRNKGIEIYIVVRMGDDIAGLKPLQQVGVNGFALSRQIIDAPDPVAATATVLDSIGK